MTEPNNIEIEAAPIGDADPNVVFIAVGQAISAWERMEEALARFTLFLRGEPIGPESLAAYGKAHGIFSERMRATRRASENFFQRFPDQRHEGDFANLMSEIEELGIKRHRVAHGHATLVGEFDSSIFQGRATGDTTTITMTMTTRWVPPFYGMEKLRAGVPGFASWHINEWRDEFTAAEIAIGQMADRFARHPSP